MDTISKEKRSWNMSRIRSKDTRPEKIVRSILHLMGYRFRLHQKSLPGKPDIVLKKYKTVIFVHGCFWHRHSGCKFAYNPKSRKKFWQKKFEDNIRRHKVVEKELKKLGWKIVVVWECQLKYEKRLSSRLKKALNKQLE